MSASSGQASWLAVFCLAATLLAGPARPGRYLILSQFGGTIGDRNTFSSNNYFRRFADLLRANLPSIQLALKLLW